MTANPTALDLDAIRTQTGPLIANLAETVRQVKEHDHPAKGGDLYCLNLTSYMGERMATVLRLLAAERAEVDRLRADQAVYSRAVADAERERDEVHEESVTTGIELANARAELEQVRAELAALRGGFNDAVAELAERYVERDTLHAALAQAVAAVDDEAVTR